MEIRKTFEFGVMNKDLDERLVPNGFFTHAENIITDATNGNDMGVIKNLLSNKKKNQLNLPADVRVLNGFSDETEQKIYYFLKSNSGCYLVEYDDANNSTSFVLADTRVNKVLDLKDEYRITSVRKIYNTDQSKNLLLWTNNDMEICCINIERAKSYGENNFGKEDIYLIKKPPIFAPKTKYLNLNIESNEIEEKFVLFAYRYKYLDGEYSALSPFSYYQFIPKAFNIDYESMQNEAMVNMYNAIEVEFNTGNHRVTDIQLVAKFSNANSIYIVETFNKQKDGLPDNSISNIIYNNRKLYTALPDKEIYRTFDNVPRKAKALSLIGNRLVLGNYTEGYNMIDLEGKKIKMQYDIDVISKDVNLQYLYPKQFSTNESEMTIWFDTLPGVAHFKNNAALDFHIVIKNDLGYYVFNKTYTHILNSNYSTFNQLLATSEFETFIEQTNNDIALYFTDDTLPGTYTITQPPKLSFAIDNTSTLIIVIEDMIYLDEDDVEHTKSYKYADVSFVKQRYIGLPTSLKSYQDYEIGIVYQDEYKRSSTVQTTTHNTVFIPIENATTQNKLRVHLQNKAPYWAKNYRIAVKTSPLAYETIFVNRFYVENGFAWVKLEGDNKDKVKANDILLLKSHTNGVASKPIKVKVLDVENKSADFILGNKDDKGADYIEEAGLYMKIRPSGFSMGTNDFKVYQDSKNGASIPLSGYYPNVTLNLFSTGSGPDIQHLAIPTGSVITLYFCSANIPDAGRQENIFNRTFYVTEDYPTLEAWLVANIINVSNLFGNEGNSPQNYAGNLEIFTGPTGIKGLNIIGTKPGMSGGRRGYLDASINVRTSDGFYVFETLPKKEVDLDIYYLSSESFEIENGLHKGNLFNQDSLNPSITEIDFFNCYTFGNGVESYKIRDGFNENYLNIDFSPTTTTIEDYKEVVRNSDITWSELYNESSNINGLNEFNTSNLNWKELDKQNGSIQLLYSRESNLLVIQEDKWGQILYGKNALYSADGEMTITATKDILRDFVPYAGTYGISDVESFVNVGNRCYAVDKKRGAVLRLSIDGITEITNGMGNWFRTIFQQRSKANVIGGYDPYNETYNICIDDQAYSMQDIQCGQTIIKHEITEAFSYNFVLNEILNDVVLNLNITEGTVNLKAITYAEFNFNGLTGMQSITIPREVYHPNIVIEVTPITPNASLEISNICPVGNPLEITSLVVNSHNDSGNVFSKSISVNNGVNYRDDITLVAGSASEFTTQIGSEGVGKFPSEGDTVNITIYNDTVVTQPYNEAIGNAVKYLITDEEYEYSNQENMINEAISISFSEVNGNKVGSFVFTRPTLNHKLYLFYDLRSDAPGQLINTFTINYNPQLIMLNDVLETDYPIEAVSLIGNSGNCSVLVSGITALTITYEGDTPNEDTGYVEFEILVNGTYYTITLNINFNILLNE